MAHNKARPELRDVDRLFLKNTKDFPSFGLEGTLATVKEDLKQIHILDDDEKCEVRESYANTILKDVTHIFFAQSR